MTFVALRGQRVWAHLYSLWLAFQTQTSQKYFSCEMNRVAPVSQKAYKLSQNKEDQRKDPYPKAKVIFGPDKPAKRARVEKRQISSVTRGSRALMWSQVIRWLCLVDPALHLAVLVVPGGPCTTSGSAGCAWWTLHYA